MNRKGQQTVKPDEDDGMLPEFDLSKAVRGYTAYRIGEERSDEMAVEEFWRGLGFEVQRVEEPGRRRSKAPDFLLLRQGVPVAVCEVKSMGEFDYSISVGHKDGTASETQHNWRKSNLERVLHRADLASDQLSFLNGDRSLVSIFVFVNHDSTVQRGDVQGALLQFTGLDATFWFGVEGDGTLDQKPVVIATREGQKRLMDQLSLAFDGRLVLASAA